MSSASIVSTMIWLNSPWGLDIAPASFGAFANDLLVGNFGSDPGTNSINVFDPNTGAFLGTLTDTSGNPIEIEGLWALANGNGGPAPNGSDPNAVFFTAGIGDETHGLFGDLAVVPEPGSLALLATGLAGLMHRRGRGGAPGTPRPAPARGDNRYIETVLFRGTARRGRRGRVEGGITPVSASRNAQSTRLSHIPTSEGRDTATGSVNAWIISEKGTVSDEPKSWSAPALLHGSVVRRRGVDGISGRARF